MFLSQPPRHFAKHFAQDQNNCYLLDQALCFPSPDAASDSDWALKRVSKKCLIVRHALWEPGIPKFEYYWKLEICLKYYCENHAVVVFLKSNTRSNEVHRVASWSTRSAAECTSWCHEVYFITSSVASQDIQRVVDKKTNEASAELVFLSTTRWISHQIERVGKQREESIKPRAEGEWFYAFLELFANEFNLVEKAPHARDFRRSILELYHNRSIRECTK